MTKYISILRGINVGGRKVIRMDSLRALYESLQFKRIKTYIQSGNVVFESGVKERLDLKASIEKAIEKEYNFCVPVEILSRAELKQVLNNSPFDSSKAAAESDRYLITFLSEPPSKADGLELKKSASPPEELFIRNREVYLYCPNGYGKSKLSNSFIERKLGICATSRNWKTVTRLLQLSE